MMWLLPAALAADPACPIPRSVEDVRAELTRVDSTWGDDAAAFNESLAALEPVLRCVVEPLSAADAARLHRARGLQAFTQRDMTAAASAFAAARALEPDYVFPEEMVPSGHPVDTLYRAAKPAGTAAPVESPKAGWGLTVDGTASLKRNPELPALVQVQAPDGRVVSSQWVAAAAALPAYPTWRSGLRGPLVGIGAGLVAAGASVWAYGAASRPEPASLETREDGLAAEARQEGFGGAAVGLGVLGAAGITVGFAVGEW